MSDDVMPIWPILALGLLGAVGFLIWMSIPIARERYARRAALEQGLELGSDIGAVVARYYVRRLRLTAFGMLAVLGPIALVAALAVAPPFEGTSAWLAGMLTIIPLITVGGGIGTLASALLWPHTSSGMMATGRLTPPSRRDVVAPWEERVQIMTVAIGAVVPVLVTAAGVGGGRPETIAALVWGALAVLALVGWRAAAVRVMRRRPIAGDAQSLAWRDALRSDAVRFGMPVPAALAMSAVMLALGSAALTVDQSGGRLGGLLISLGLFAFSLGYLSVTIALLATGASRRWLRRLQPELAKGATA